MSRSIGDYLAERLKALQNWRSIAKTVAQLAEHLVPGARVYVFGSVLTGRVTDSSVIDVLVVVPDNQSVREVHVQLALKLEELPGSLSYIVDLHVVRREDLGKPPFKWRVEKSVEISRGRESRHGKARIRDL